MAVTWDDLRDRGEPGQCRSCRYPIQWILTEKGKRAPYNAAQTDLTEPPVSHFATCPESQAWRRSKSKA